MVCFFLSHYPVTKTPLSVETIVSQTIFEVIFVVISNMDPVAIVLID